MGAILAMKTEYVVVVEEQAHFLGPAYSFPIIPTSVNTKRGYACYDCCISSPAFVCMHAAL